MNYNFASIKGLGPGSLPFLRKIHKARRAENFSGNEQNSSSVKVFEQNFEQNKRFLRAVPAGKISHFTSRIYPSLEHSSKQRERRDGCILRRDKPEVFYAVLLKSFHYRYKLGL